MRYSVIFRRARTGFGLFAACILMGLGLARCGNEQIDLTPLESVSCDTTDISYAEDIKPVIEVNCINRGCHNTLTSSAAGEPPEANWDVFSTLQRYALEENLLSKIDGTHTEGERMPLNGAPLSQCEIEAVRAWIDQGAPQN